MLSQEEVLLFFDHVPGLKNRAALMTCYGAGLPISEAVALKVSDIDGKRKLIRVEQGKGQKDRYAMLSERLHMVLRRYSESLPPRILSVPLMETGPSHEHHSATAGVPRSSRPFGTP